MKNSMANMPNNEKVKRKTILDLGILFLRESSLVSPSRLAYLAKVCLFMLFSEEKYQYSIQSFSSEKKLASLEATLVRNKTD